MGNRSTGKRKKSFFSPGPVASPLRLDHLYWPPLPLPPFKGIQNAISPFSRKRKEGMEGRWNKYPFSPAASLLPSHFQNKESSIFEGKLLFSSPPPKIKGKAANLGSKSISIFVADFFWGDGSFYTKKIPNIFVILPGQFQNYLYINYKSSRSKLRGKARGGGGGGIGRIKLLLFLRFLCLESLMEERPGFRKGGGGGNWKNRTPLKLDTRRGKPGRPVGQWFPRDLSLYLVAPGESAPRK